MGCVVEARGVHIEVLAGRECAPSGETCSELARACTSWSCSLSAAPCPQAFLHSSLWLSKRQGSVPDEVATKIATPCGRPDPGSRQPLVGSGWPRDPQPQSAFVHRVAQTSLSADGVAANAGNRSGPWRRSWSSREGAHAEEGSTRHRVRTRDAMAPDSCGNRAKLSI
eukprot:scaffold1461_cov253-Pinguiococcus_pyrenoidosus.AAC.14